MRVLLAVDGSEYSKQASEVIRELASVESLTILHVIDLPRLTYPMIGPDIAKDLAMTVEQAMRNEAEQVLKHTMSHLSTHSFPVDRRLEEGTPAERILALAQDIKADLIVLGVRGVGQIKELVVGSVSHRVLTHAPCPVLLVKAPIKETKKVLLPLQDLDDVQRVKPFLSRHPFHKGTEITAFTVVSIPRSFLRAGVSASESKIQRALESTESFLDDAVSQLHRFHYSVTGIVGMGEPAATILQQEAEMKPDLIMMGVNQPSAVSQFLVGSVSHTILHHSNCSVLFIR
ncbi:MAG: universal stress protein [Nitrospirales bacterium]|nr:MAG: universal stress protein [Nitrospirales bacterium]